MTIREIPRTFLYSCDACEREHRQENASGHYTESVPPHWSRIRIREGSVVDETFKAFEYLLCESCALRTILAINRVMDNIKGEPKHDTD